MGALKAAGPPKGGGLPLCPKLPSLCPLIALPATTNTRWPSALEPRHREGLASAGFRYLSPAITRDYLCEIKQSAGFVC